VRSLGPNHSTLETAPSEASRKTSEEGLGARLLLTGAKIRRLWQDGSSRSPNPDRTAAPVESAAADRFVQVPQKQECSARLRGQLGERRHRRSNRLILPRVDGLAQEANERIDDDKPRLHPLYGFFDLGQMFGQFQRLAGAICGHPAHNSRCVRTRGIQSGTDSVPQIILGRENNDTAIDAGCVIWHFPTASDSCRQVQGKCAFPCAGIAIHNSELREGNYGKPTSGKDSVGVNAKLLLTEQRTFQDSRDSLGLQLSDMLAAILRRALNDRLQFPGWKHFGGLLVRHNQPGKGFVQLGTDADTLMLGHARKVCRVLHAKAKNMFAERNRNAGALRR
jgi:hypothetical protein